MTHGGQQLHQPDDRRKSYSRDVSSHGDNRGGGGEYFDSPSYQPQSMAPPSHAYQLYRSMHTGEEGASRAQSQHHHFGQHRPWSPHHRAQQQHHQSPTHSGVAFGSDSRYSPYNRQIDSARDTRQHMSPGVRISTL
ncbi:hypothetical protein LPJ56_005118, partial [Coemansia sp. RSA 2599]